MQNNNNNQLVESKTENNFKLVLSSNKIEIYCENSVNILEDIDLILYYKDLANKIELNSEIRKKYLYFFSSNQDSIQFLFDVEKWPIWEKMSLVLLARHPFSTEKSYICNHGIESKHLSTYIDRHNDHYIQFENGSIGLSFIGYNSIISKLNEMLAEKGDS